MPMIRGVSVFACHLRELLLDYVLASICESILWLPSPEQTALFPPQANAPFSICLLFHCRTGSSGWTSLFCKTKSPSDNMISAKDFETVMGYRSATLLQRSSSSLTVDFEIGCSVICVSSRFLAYISYFVVKKISCSESEISTPESQPTISEISEERSQQRHAPNFLLYC